MDLNINHRPGKCIPICPVKYCHLKLFQLFYGAKEKNENWAFVEESYQDFNLTGQTLLETGTDWGWAERD